jgi:hypothetical protein
MFKRLILEDYATLCTLVAFIVAATIFIATVWRAIRMPRAQVEHLAQLPFETNSTDHDEHA